MFTTRVYDTEKAPMQKIAALLRAIPFDMAWEVGAERVAEMLNGRKTGTFNQRVNRRRSAKGEAPAKDTGYLISSMDIKRAGAEAATLAFTAPYAPILESAGWDRPILPKTLIPGWEARMREKALEVAALLR